MPSHARDQILSNVYCTNCRGAVSIVSVTGTLERGNLVLKGDCAKCGSKVARLIEGADA